MFQTLAVKLKPSLPLLLWCLMHPWSFLACGFRPTAWSPLLLRSPRRSGIDGSRQMCLSFPIIAMQIAWVQPNCFAASRCWSIDGWWDPHGSNGWWGTRIFLQSSLRKSPCYQHTKWIVNRMRWRLFHDKTWMHVLPAWIVDSCSHLSLESECQSCWQGLCNHCVKCLRQYTLTVDGKRVGTYMVDWLASCMSFTANLNRPPVSLNDDDSISGSFHPPPPPLFGHLLTVIYHVKKLLLCRTSQCVTPKKLHTYHNIQYTHALLFSFSMKPTLASVQVDQFL